MEWQELNFVSCLKQQRMDKIYRFQDIELQVTYDTKQTNKQTTNKNTNKLSSMVSQLISLRGFLVHNVERGNLEEMAVLSRRTWVSGVLESKRPFSEVISYIFVTFYYFIIINHLGGWGITRWNIQCTFHLGIPHPPKRFFKICTLKIHSYVVKFHVFW